jgi:hypothetical protein
LSNAHLDGLDGFVDVQYLSMLHPIGVGTAKPNDLQFTEFVLPAGNRSDLRRTDVQPDDDGLLLIVHVVSCF